MVPILDLSGRWAGPAIVRFALLSAALAGCTTPTANGPSSANTHGSPDAPPDAQVATPAGQGAAASTVPVPPGAQSARVRSVVDGDTLHLVATGDGPLPAGSDIRVRLLEINAPEIHGTIQCFGPEATTTLARLTPVGSTVRLIGDRQARDKYDRPLVYVWNANGTFVNEAQVSSGAAVALLIAPNDRYIAVMRSAQMRARAARVGQWATCP